MPTLPNGIRSIWLGCHFARCNQMNEEQKRIKTAARIREAGRRRTDLSVELIDTRSHAQKASQESHQKNEIDVTELQKKLANMVKTVKVEQMNWKEERLLARPPPPSFFQEEMDL